MFSRASTESGNENTKDASKSGGSTSGLILFVIFVSVILSMCTSTKSTRSPLIQTQATVLEAQPYVSPPRANQTQPQPLRVRIRFAYVTERGTRFERRRLVRVKSYDEVATGDLITIKYRKRRPKYARVVSLRPPPPKVSAPQRRYFGALKLETLMHYAVIPIVLLLVYLGVTRIAARIRPTHAGRYGRSTSDRHREREARQGREQRRAQTVVFSPKHKSKVVQRAGWFG